MLANSVLFCSIFLFLSFFCHPSHSHKTSQTLFDHPLTSNSFNLFTEIQDPEIKFYSPSDIDNPRFHKLVFLPNNVKRNYYNTLSNADDNNILYVMGEDFLYKFDASDLYKAHRSHRFSKDPAYQPIKKISLAQCKKNVQPRNRGPTPDYICGNHLQSLHPIPTPSSPSLALVCTTGNGRSQLFVIDTDTMRLVKVVNDTTLMLSSGYGICSNIPYTLSTTLVTSSSSSPSSYFLVGAASRGGFFSNTISLSKLDAETFHVTYYDAADLYTAIEDVSYIASFQNKNYVFIFSHEKGSLKDPLKEDETHYTMVTRLCKDRMYPVMKVKLKCRGGGLPYYFYFNKLKSVIYEEKTDLLHALFTTEEEIGSAICIFKLSEIDAVFLRAYTIIVTDRSTREEVDICIKSKKLDFFFDQCNITDKEKTTYTKEEGILFDSMTHPFAFNDSQRFSFMTVERLNFQECIGEFHPAVDLGCYIYWLYDATRPGYLYRIFNRNLYQQYETVAINNVRIFKDPDDISNLWDMQFKTINNIGYIFIVTDRYLVRINTKLCSSQNRCTTCATDPHCMWDLKIGECVQRHYDMRNADRGRYIFRKFGESSLKLCQPHCYTLEKIQKTSDSSLQLLCHSKCHPDTYPLWFINGQPIHYYNVDEFDDLIAAKRINTPFNLNDLPHTTNYGDEYNRKLSQTIKHNPYFQKGAKAPKERLAVADPRDFGVHVLSLKYQNHSGSYECRDQHSGVVLAAYEVSVNKYCKYGTDLESTWKKEYEKWCGLYEEQVHMHSCYKKCSGEKACYKGCLEE